MFSSIYGLVQNVNSCKLGLYGFMQLDPNSFSVLYIYILFIYMCNIYNSPLYNELNPRLTAVRRMPKNVLGKDHLGGSSRDDLGQRRNPGNRETNTSPVDPRTFLGSVWGMIWRVKYLLRNCLDP